MNSLRLFADEVMPAFRALLTERSRGSKPKMPS